MEQNKNNKNNILKFLIIILIIIILTIALTSFIYYKYKIVQISEIPLNFETGNTIGFNTDKDALHFGIIMPGTSVFREINITNNNDFTVKTNIKVDSDDTDCINLISLEDNGFFIKNKESKKIRVFVEVPKNSEYKKCEAIIKVVMLRV